jgi:hypothetical protein
MYVPLFLCLDLCVFLKDDKLGKQKKVLDIFCIYVLLIKKAFRLEGFLGFN